jgi:hypothetical protein
MPASFSRRGVPRLPSVYALWAGEGRSIHVASVGSTSSLRHRLDEHLVRRNSSVATGVSAVGLNVDLLTRVTWWTTTGFEDRDVRHAAELIAFDVLKPVLRSRGTVDRKAKVLSTKPAFRRRIRRLFLGTPTGSIELTEVQAFSSRLAELELRVAALEQDNRHRSSS